MDRRGNVRSGKRLPGASRDHDLRFRLGTRTLGVGVMLAMSFSCAKAHAESELVTNDIGIIQYAQASTPSTGLRAVIPPAPGPAPDRFALIDKYKIKGWDISVPGAANSIDQGLFGVREALAEAGNGYLVVENTYFSDNVIHHGHPPGNSRDLQQYAGQLPTYVSQTIPYLTYDLSRYGIPDGQIVIGGNYTSLTGTQAGQTISPLGAELLSNGI